MLLTFECDHEPSLGDAAEILGVEEEAIDAGYGIVAVDPESHLYSVRVTDEGARPAAIDGKYRGPYADPKIAPLNWEPEE